MVTIITELSKYAMILSLAIYTVLGFRLVRRNEAGKKAALWQQNVLMFGMQFLGNLTLYLSTENEKILLFYIAQLGAFILFLVLQRVIYPNADQLLNHNMLLLLSVGLLMLARLSFDKAARQAELAALAAVLTFVIPVIIRKSGRLRNLYWLYGAAGFGLLAWSLLPKYHSWSQIIHYRLWNQASAIGAGKSFICVFCGGYAS